MTAGPDRGGLWRGVIAWSSSALVLLALAIAALFEPLERFQAGNAVTGAGIVLRRGHRSFVPFDATWVLASMRDVPWLGLAIVAAGALGLAGLSLVHGGRARPWSARAFLAVGVGAALVSWAFPVSYELNSLLGDGLTLPANAGAGRTYGAEVGTSALMAATVQGLALFDMHDAVRALHVLDAAVAFVLGTGAAILADAATSTERGRAALLAGLLAVGTTMQVMGYIETTMLELAALALYVGAVARVLARRPGPSARTAAWSGLGIAVLAHGAGGLALPSVLGWAFRDGLRRGFVQNAMLFVFTVVVPFSMLVAPRWVDDDMGNADGGGDHIRFVPAVFEGGVPPSRMVYYERFQGLHWADLGNAMLVAAPIAPLVLLGLALVGRAARPSSTVRFLFVLSLFTFVIPLLWNHDFGMWGDWNLASTYLFPLHAMSWVWLVQTLEQLGAERRPWALTLGALGAVQMLGLVGLALQLY